MIGEQITLGELLKQLRRCRDDEGETDVRFDFCGAIPTDFRSYRGFYDQVALGYGFGGIDTVEQLMCRVQIAIGKTYEGYKGGQFTMTEDTPVWVDVWGEYTSTAIVGVEYIEYQAIIRTAHIPYRRI